MEIFAKVSLFETLIIYIIAIPYSLLIHLGMVAFVLSIFLYLAKRTIPKLNWITVVACVYGSLFGLAPYLYLIVIYDRKLDDQFIGLPLLMMDLPALALTESLPRDSELLAIFFYLIFGFIGGLGLGQLIDASARIARRKKGSQAAKP